MMTTTFTDEEIQVMATNAINNVFSTMLSSPVSLKTTKVYPNDTETKPATSVFNGNEAQISSSVGFAGLVNGVMHLTVLESVAMVLACKFLGMEKEEVEEEGIDTIDDTMGELANMIAGDFKNKLCDRGFQCMLTLPSVVRGGNLKIQSKIDEGARRHNYDFQTCSSSLIVDLILKHKD
jgi:chemotaxis protein CheX